MLSILRLPSYKQEAISDDVNTKRPLMELLEGFITYIKGIKLFDAVLPPSLTLSGDSQNEDSKKSQDLFPTTIKYEKDLLKNITATPCSTSQQPTSKLLKYEEVDGTINWKFSEHVHHQQGETFSSLTSPFLTSSGSTVSGGEFSPTNNLNLLGQASPSPISINNMNNSHNHQFFSNSNSDLDSTHSLEEDLANIPDLPDPEFFDIQTKNKKNSNTPSTSPTSESSFSSSSDKNQKVYICEYCGSEFRIRGYLTRHIKKHAITKAYECPFYDESSENKCHPNGGFSRRDTYKTHLKARHFKYPTGTKSQDRATTAGKCGLCSKPYENNEEWVEKHIENGQCEGLPKGFQIRIKNSRKKNYQFPNINNDEVSSSNESTTESPISSHTPTTNTTIVSNLKTLDEEQESINKRIIMNSLQFQQEKNTNNTINNINNTNDNINNINASLLFPQTLPMKLNQQFHEYDDNDEYSLDMEQCSYRPIRINGCY